MGQGFNPDLLNLQWESGGIARVQGTAGLQVDQGMMRCRVSHYSAICRTIMSSLQQTVVVVKTWPVLMHDMSAVHAKYTADLPGNTPAWR